MVLERGPAASIHCSSPILSRVIPIVRAEFRNDRVQFSLAYETNETGLETFGSAFSETICYILRDTRYAV